MMRFILTTDWSGKPSDVGQVSVIGDVEDVYADARFGPAKKLVRELSLQELGHHILVDASAEPSGWRVAYFTGVELPPKLQGKGYGTEMVRRIFTFLRRNNVTYGYAHELSETPMALAGMWKHFGWRQTIWADFQPVWEGPICCQSRYEV